PGKPLPDPAEHSLAPRRTSLLTGSLPHCRATGGGQVGLTQQGYLGYGGRSFGTPARRSGDEGSWHGGILLGQAADLGRLGTLADQRTLPALSRGTRPGWTALFRGVCGSVIPSRSSARRGPPPG